MKQKLTIKKEAIGEMIRFSIVGVLVTAIHYGVYWLLQLVMDVNIAWTAGYIAGFIVNYYLSAYYIFRKKTSAKNGAGFSLAHIVNYLLQMVLLNFFIAFSPFQNSSSSDYDNVFCPLPDGVRGC